MEAQADTYRWNADDYARNASAQYRWAGELIEKLKLQGDERLLDIGCGDGRISAELAAMLPQGRVVAIDASAEMIALAQRNYPAAEHANLAFQQMDARAIDFTRKFDVAFSNAALHWVDDHRAVLQGVERALMHGGRLLLQMGGHGNAAELFAILDEVITSPPWRDSFSGFAVPYTFHHCDDYERWLPEYGFIAQRIELIPKIMRHENRDALKGWFRTTWFPYTDRLPAPRREPFIDEVIDRYLAAHPADSSGATAVAMVRLEVEAIKV